jgi:hypothetical protein
MEKYSNFKKEPITNEEEVIRLLKTDLPGKTYLKAWFIGGII